MCMIQTYDVIYPDGARRTSERLVNCERGTPSQPCTNTSHEPYLHERDATPAEVCAAHVERHPSTSPSSSERPRSHRQSRDKPKGVLGLIDRLFGISVRTSPKKHHETEPQRLFVRNRRRRPRPHSGRAEERQPIPAHPPPRAPTPPVYPPPPPPGQFPMPTSPVVVPIEPPREYRSRRQGYHPRGRRPIPQEREMEREPRRRKRRSAVIHQSNSEESPSPPTASRRHQRRTRSLSPRSRYEEEKRAVRERERQEHLDRLARVARLEQDAHDRAVRLAENERRNRRLDFEERRSIESVERPRRRQPRDEEERYRRRGEARRREEEDEEERYRRRGEARRRQEEEERHRRRDEARRRQEEADIERLRQHQDRIAEQERLGRLRRAHIPRQPRHQPTVHGESLDARGDRFIRDAIRAENPRQMERERRMPPAAYGRYDGGLLGRRNTVDGGQRRRRGWEDSQW